MLGDTNRGDRDERRACYTLSIHVTAGRMAGDSATPVPLFVPHGLGCGLGGTSSLDVYLPSWLFTP